MALLLHLVLFAVLSLSVSSTDDTDASASEPVIAAGLVDLSGLSADVVTGVEQPQIPAPESTAPAVQPSQSPVPEPLPAEPEPAAQEEVFAAENEQPRSDSISSSTDTSNASPMNAGGRPYSDEERKQRILALRKASRAEEKPEQDTYVRGRILQSTASPIRAIVRVTNALGDNEADRELLTRYQADLQEAFLKYWVRPYTVAVGEPCRITIEQSPGGEVVEVRVDDSCPFDESGRRSITDAIQQAQPLPHVGYESVMGQPLSLVIEAFTTDLMYKSGRKGEPRRQP